MRWRRRALALVWTLLIARHGCILCEGSPVRDRLRAVYRTRNEELFIAPAVTSCVCGLDRVVAIVEALPSRGVWYWLLLLLLVVLDLGSDRVLRRGDMAVSARVVASK